MTKKAGSYAFGRFDENQSELDRLNLQAAIAIEIEKKEWGNIGLEKGMNVIDCACGSGLVTLELAKYVYPGQVLGVDISKDLLIQAEKNKEKSGIENVSFTEGNIYDLNNGVDKFDLAYARFLFQHLEHSEKALENILKVLKPGGILCSVDVDDGFLMLSVAEEEFRKFSSNAAEGQEKNGGDRYVGHKLGKYYYDTGFRNIHTGIQVVTSDDIGLENFLDITTGFKLEQIPGEDKQKNLDYLEKIYDTVSLPYAWGGIGVFVVTGEKPK